MSVEQNTLKCVGEMPGELLFSRKENGDLMKEWR